MTPEVQEDGVGKFGTIDEIVLSKAVTVQDGSVDVDDHVSVVCP